MRTPVRRIERLGFVSLVRSCARCAVPAGVPVLGPVTNVLQDSGERLKLERPEGPDTHGVVPYVVVDEVRYNDAPPWSAAADGGAIGGQHLVVRSGFHARVPTRCGLSSLPWEAAAMWCRRAKAWVPGGVDQLVPVERRYQP